MCRETTNMKSKTMFILLRRERSADTNSIGNDWYMLKTKPREKARERPVWKYSRKDRWFYNSCNLLIRLDKEIENGVPIYLRRFNVYHAVRDTVARAKQFTSEFKWAVGGSRFWAERRADECSFVSPLSL